MESMKKTIVDLQKKNADISNKNVHLEAMVTSLEQQIQDMEQQKLIKCVEISDVPSTEHENVFAIAETVAKKLKQPVENIANVTRLEGNKGIPGIIQIELKTENMKMNWLKAARKINMTAADIIPGHNPLCAVRVKEALTAYRRNLIWQTRQELKDKLNETFSKRGFMSVCTKTSKLPTCRLIFRRKKYSISTACPYVVFRW